MKTIYIRGGAKKNTAVGVLTAHLTGLGHEVVRSKELGFDAMLCWGMSPQGIPGRALNSKVNSVNKYEAILKFHEAHVPAPFVTRYQDVVTEDFQPGDIWLARNFQHKQGRDIQICKTPQDTRNAECDFYSRYIPTETEYRVWVFGDKNLAVYEKVWKGEGEYEGIQRNHRFGFRYEKRDALRADRLLTQYAVDAVKAIALDFGAVDIILGKDRKYYVLEVNSMPDIDTPQRSSGIRLANQISQWAEQL